MKSLQKVNKHNRKNGFITDSARCAAKMLKLGNHGGGIVMVIVAIALVSVLTSVFASIALLNYQMKYTERGEKENFYSAEGAMDLIHAGLEYLVSDAIKVAYTESIQKYKMEYTVAGTTYSESQRILDFRTKYVKLIMDQIRVSDTDVYYAGGDAAEFVDPESDGTGTYNAGLAKFLDENYAGLLKNGILKIENHWDTDPLNTNPGSLVGSIKPLSTGILLRDVYVSYLDSTNGYFTEIKTDIKIGYPDVSLSESSVLPNVYDFSFIAGTGVKVENVSGALKGGLFAGNNGISIKGSTGFSVTSDADFIVSTGGVVIDGSASNTKVDLSPTDVWVRDIQVIGSDTPGTGKTSAVLTGNSTFHVADDLTLSKKNVSVALDGDYYGFNSNETLDADGNLNVNAQSAIQVNSANSELNLSALDTLLLAGTSFLSGGSVAQATGVTTPLATPGNVRLGTSLSVKTDQIVYLAPPEVLGTYNGNSLIGMNPMSAAQYQKWLNDYETAYGADYEAFNAETEVKALGDSRLSEYGLTNSSYRCVFAQKGSDSIVYVFLDFPSAELAAKYYDDYMTLFKDKVYGYLGRYDNDIVVNDSTDVLTAGRMVSYIYSSKYGTYMDDPSVPQLQILGADSAISKLTSAKRDELDERVTLYQNSYNAMCSKLSMNFNGLTLAERTRNNAYANIINETAVAAAGTAGKTYTDTTGNNKVFIVNNTNELTVGNGASFNSLPTSVDSNEYKLIIASGDVRIKGNFTGLIICGGTISVDNYTGIEIASDSATVDALLQTQTETGDTVIATYFLNGNRYSMDETVNGDAGYVDLGGVITYVNWTKN